MDSVYRLRYTFSHRGSAAQIWFSGANLEPLDDESWGITNVRVAVAAAPRPASAAVTPSKTPPAPKPTIKSAAVHPVAVRRVTQRPKTRAIANNSKRAAKPSSKTKAKPAVKRIHDKKVAPKS
jgi:hypothetical protein